jgi:hypothetical protein
VEKSFAMLVPLELSILEVQEPLAVAAQALWSLFQLEHVTLATNQDLIMNLMMVIHQAQGLLWHLDFVDTL